MSQVNDVKQIMITRFEKPINEVEEAFKEILQHTTHWHGMSFLLINKLSKKIDNLKAKLPTVQR